MRTGTVLSSFLQVPRCKIYNVASIWGETYHSFSENCQNNSTCGVLGLRIYGLERRHSKKWTRRPVTTKTEGRSKTDQSTKSSSIKHEMFGETILTSTSLNINKTETEQQQNIQYFDIRQEILKNKTLASLVTILVFDIETTGLSRQNERIIEIALRDLAGGKNSTFQTLVNPERFVPNSHVHGITTQMVSRPDVPRMKDLIPILLHYVESRRKPGGYVLLVAHNSRCFDVPFLINEFFRCSRNVPNHWRFLDSLPLSRDAMKSRGLKTTSRTSLSALREFYNVKSVGSAHRAMADVHTLSSILPLLTNDLKLPISALLEKSFSCSDLINLKKKTSG